jgi:hypothetical protein
LTETFRSLTSVRPARRIFGSPLIRNRLTAGVIGRRILERLDEQGLESEVNHGIRLLKIPLTPTSIPRKRPIPIQSQRKGGCRMQQTTITPSRNSHRSRACSRLVSRDNAGQDHDNRADEHAERHSGSQDGKQSARE